MRRAAVETGLQQPPATSIATIKPSYYCPPVTSRPDALRSVACTLRVSKIPIAGRPALRAPSPAGSFFGGFRTPGTVHLASPASPASETLHITGREQMQQMNVRQCGYSWRVPAASALQAD